jgi:hypothetical protein
VGLKRDVLDWMEAGLPKVLTYHCVDYTKDVLKAAIRIGEAEGLSDSELSELKAAAVLHDSGFVISFKDHEESSCKVAKKKLCPPPEKVVKEKASHKALLSGPQVEELTYSVFLRAFHGHLRLSKINIPTKKI